MTEMHSSTVLSCWAVTKERRETGSELWRGCGNSTIIPINCFGNCSAKCCVSSATESADKQLLQADRFLYDLGIMFWIWNIY